MHAVPTLLAGPGMIKRLDFGGFILLRSEALSRYAAAVVRKVRKHPQELGCIREDELLAGYLDYQDFKRLPRKDEAVVLRTLLETCISRAWCLRQPCDGSAMLTFPSYFRRERKEQPSHPSVLVTYRFDPPADDIYATLVVRLHHTVAFESTDLWKSAADFKTQTGTKLGFTLSRGTEGSSRLEVRHRIPGNANGVLSSSPGLPAKAGYPGSLSDETSTLKGLNRGAPGNRLQLQGCGRFVLATQGSRFAPTLG